MGELDKLASDKLRLESSNVGEFKAEERDVLADEEDVCESMLSELSESDNESELDDEDVAEFLFES